MISNSRAFQAFLAIVLVAMFVQAIQLFSQAREEWPFESGWIVLSLIEENITITGETFRILEPVTPTDNNYNGITIPAPGDIIELIRDNHGLVILGYRQTFTERELESPAGKQLSPDDHTEYETFVGQRLRVEDVQISDPSPAGVQVIWVRVSQVD